MHIIATIGARELIFLHSSSITFLKTLLDLTDVCPLLTKQYKQVGLQIQYMFYVFRWSLSAFMARLRVFGLQTYGFQH
jgi:hypothetical protein